MEKQVFSPMAIDALGEMMNISLGSSATAVSNMLDHRVDITTPMHSLHHSSVLMCQRFLLYEGLILSLLNISLIYGTKLHSTYIKSRYSM